MSYYKDNEKKLLFTIDRLTIMADLIDENSFAHISTFISPIEEAYLCRHSDTSIFELSYNITGFGYVQLDRVDKRIRIDFNPNKIDLEGKKILNFLLKFCKNIHYSRLDLAIDLYNYNIGSYNILDIGNRKSAYFI